MKRIVWIVVALGLTASGVTWQSGFGEPRETAAATKPATAGRSYRERLGRDTYSHYCETCHGAEGKGDGFNAFNLAPKPPDFTAASFQQARSDEQLAAVIAKGGAAAGRSANMPPWGKTLSSAQRAAVLLHVRRFGR